MPPANPMAASAIWPPKVNAIGLRWKYSAAGNTSRNTPMVSLNILGSASAISSVPIGTPARPPIRKGHDQPEIDGPPDRWQRRGLRHDRADQDQRHRDRGWQHIEPDSERHQRGAETGEPRYETAGECAEEQERICGRVQLISSSVIPGRIEDASPEYRDYPMHKSTSEVWSFGPSRNDEYLNCARRLHDVAGGYYRKSFNDNPKETAR